MKILALLLLVVLGVVAALAALNREIFFAPADIFIGVTTVQAPLGLVMLGSLVFVTVLFLVFTVYMQTSALLETRRNARDLRANRELADQAEASRLTELRAFLEAESKKQADMEAELRTVILTRMDQLEHDLRASAEQSENTLTAYIGELEDRIERGTLGSASRSVA